MQQKKILVTGGGGFLGFAICKKLKELGCSPYTFSRKSYEKLNLISQKQFIGDLANYDDLSCASKNMDIIFHSAAKTGIGNDYEKFYSTNVLGTKNVASLCMENNIALVYTSSPCVVFDRKNIKNKSEKELFYPSKSLCAYQATKIMAEKHIIKKCEQGKLKAIILRPHLIWGPYDENLVGRIIKRADKLKKFKDRNNLIDTCYIENAADAHILAAKALLQKKHLSGKKYFISNGEPINIWYMTDRILEAAGKEKISKEIPYKLAWCSGFFLEFLYKIFKIKKEPLMTRFLAEELGHDHYFDINAAKSDFGYKPKISIDEGFKILKKHFEQCRF